MGRLCGIDVFLHWSFLIVPAWVALTSLAAGATLVSAVNATLFVLAVFGCVLLHELGHALAARRYGIATHDITLFPIGGLARLERMPTRPWQEIVIALAGPAVNLLIAAALIGGSSVASSLESLLTYSPLTGSFLANLVAVNIGLLVFNLLPALPMDGGRVLRAVLATAMPYSKATWAAATLAQFLAVGMGAIGLTTGSVNLMFIALFVFMAARREASEADAGTLADSKSAIVPHPPIGERSSWVILPAYARADEATSALVERQDCYPVARCGDIVGFVTRGQLLWAIATGRGDRLIVELMNRTGDDGPQVAFASVRTRP